MDNLNRDLLVLFKKELLSPKALEHHVNYLHRLLFQAETIENFISSHEIIDINRHKIITAPKKIFKRLRKNKFKPFVFLNSKN